MGAAIWKNRDFAPHPVAVIDEHGANLRGEFAA
jgi:hypothetical protein